MFLLFLRNISTCLLQDIFQADPDTIGYSEDGFKRRMAKLTFHVADCLLSQATLRRQGIF